MAVAAVVVAAAAALRLADLAGQPGGLYPDEAAEGLDAHRLLHQAGYHPVFFHDDAGREALFGYLVATAFRFAGESVTVLRGVAAAVGVLAVVALWPALRRFGAWTAVAGMAWAAGSLWLVCVSRDGFRVILVPLAGALALAALLWWSDRPDRGRALVAGAAVAAGLWTYQPLKLTPLLVALWLWRIRACDRERYLAMRRSLMPLAVAFIVVASPMAWAAASDPGNYFGRGASVTAFNPDQGPAALPLHALRTLGMFGVTGDPNERHDVSGLPLLSVPLAALLLLGAWRCWRRRSDRGHVLLLLGLAVFLVPPLIATEGGAPHFLRALGLAPYVAGLVGMGCVELVQRARGVGGTRLTAAITAAALGALLAATGAAGAAAYFSRPEAQRYDPYTFDLVALAAQCRDPGTACVVDGFASMDVRFLDAASPPVILDPGSRLPDARRFRRIAARKRGELAHVAGGAAAARATVAARDPGGHPAVWVAAP